MKTIIRRVLIFMLATIPLLNMQIVEAEKQQPHQQGKSVAIIGGGIAGLAAATFLSNSEHQVYLFEAEDKLGGHAQTRRVPNGFGRIIEADLGAQNFIAGQWDLYIQFLKLYDLYNKDHMFSFYPNATLAKSGAKPHFVTPELTREKLRFLIFSSKLKSFYTVYKVHKAGHKLFKQYPADYSQTVDHFLDQLNVSRYDRDHILLPVLASTLGLNVETARRLSARAVAELVAFNPPLHTTKMTVLKNGMGGAIDRMGTLLEQQADNVIVKRSSFVQEITKVNNHYQVKYIQNGEAQEITVDKIITAAHPPQVMNFMRNTYGSDDSISYHLSRMEYFQNRVILHLSASHEQKKLTSFVNMEYDENGETAMTMRMSKVDEVYYGRINKTWTNNDLVYQRIKRDDTILDEKEFWHPVPTPNFVSHRNYILHALATEERYKDLAIAGGWMEIVETQATAISSAYKAVYRLFPELMLLKEWERSLPAISQHLN